MKHTGKQSTTTRKRGNFAVRRTAQILAAGALLLAGSGAFAATDTYNGTGTTFSTGFPGIASGDTLSFGAGGNTAIVNDLATLQIGPGDTIYPVPDGIDFTSDAPAYTLSGNDFILGGNIVNSSGVLQTINNNFMEFNGNPAFGLIYDTGTGGLTFGGSIDNGLVYPTPTSGTGPTNLLDLNKLGSGTLTLLGKANNTQSFFVHDGSVVLGNGSVNTNEFFSEVGTDASQSGTLTLEGNSVYNNLNHTGGPTWFDVGEGLATGTLNTDGTSQLNVGNDFNLAIAPGAVGTVNINDNSQINVTGNSHLGLGLAGAANVPVASGTININGGTMNFSGGYISIGTASNVPTIGAMNVNSGSYLNPGNGLFIVGDWGTGTLSISGTGLVDTEGGEGIRIGAQANGGANGSGTGVGTVNLDGGTLRTDAIIKHSLGGQDNNLGTLNFNGGTLSTNADATDYIQTSANNPLDINVRNGGAVIDTNSHAIAINLALTHSAIAGDNATDGGLTKNDAGTLTLTAANTYTGATTVNGGRLALANTTGPAVADTSVVVNGDGTGGAAGAVNGVLALGAANQLNPTTNITLHGGTVTIAGTSGSPSNSQGTSKSATGVAGTPEASGPGTTAATFGAGTLTVQGGNSYLDFGAGNTGAVFAFSGYDFSSPGSLFIENYTGNPFDPASLLPAVGGGPDQLYFGGSGQTNQQLAKVFFVNPSGETGTFQARLLSTGEVAAPEPGELVALLLGAFGLVGLVAAKRRKAAA